MPYHQGMKTSHPPDRYAAVRRVLLPLGYALSGRIESFAAIQPPQMPPAGYLREAHVTVDCGCSMRQDHDGEKITTHCPEHCPRVYGGDWTVCRGC
jgi:hypothetical protein